MTAAEEEEEEEALEYHDLHEDWCYPTHPPHPPRRPNPAASVGIRNQLSVPSPYV